MQFLNLLVCFPLLFVHVCEKVTQINLWKSYIVRSFIENRHLAYKIYGLVTEIYE